MTYSADIITGGPCQNERLLQSFMGTVVTAKATAPNARLLWMDGNSEPGPIREHFKKFLASLGYEYVLIDEPYNCARWWILGKQLTAKWGGEFTVFAACDLIFHAAWLDNIVDLWREHPEFYVLAPYSWTPEQLGLNYRIEPTSSREIIECDHPAPWCFVRRRDDDYVPDIRFRDWNVEFDFYEWMRARHLKAGVCNNARVDHTGWGPRKLGDFGMDLNENIAVGDALFHDKWHTAHVEGYCTMLDETRRAVASKLYREELSAAHDMDGTTAIFESHRLIIEAIELPKHAPPWRRGEPVVYILKPAPPSFTKARIPHA
jgi:hypothetical protein